MSEIKLKPCPFCGAAAKFYPTSPIAGCTTFANIGCDTKRDGVFCPGHFVHNYAHDDNALVRIWNARAGEEVCNA